MRQTIKEIQVNMAYRWFLGYSPQDAIPHFTTFGKNYVRRFQHTDIFEQIFDHILAVAIEKGFVDPKAIFIDSTHVKAHANKNLSEKWFPCNEKPIKKASMTRDLQGLSLSPSVYPQPKSHENRTEAYLGGLYGTSGGSKALFT